MKLTIMAGLLAAAVIANPASASDWEHCYLDASKRYQIPARVLRAIARVESGEKTGAINEANRNGTTDYGLMQINSQHLQRLKRYNISKSVLLNNPCANIHVGAWILAENMVTAKGKPWLAIGAYNAGFRESTSAEKARNRYIGKVRRALASIKEEENGIPEEVY